MDSKEKQDIGKNSLVDTPSKVFSTSKSFYFIVFIFLIMIPLSFTTYKRNTVWKDEVMLWGDVVNKHSGKERGYNNFGLAYYNQGRIDEAIREYTIALHLKPEEAKIHSNLGLAYWKKGLEDMAREEFEIALKLKPDFLPAKQAIESLNR